MTSLSGTWTLTRLALRRDRIRIPIWIVAVCGFMIGLLPSLTDVYPDAAARQGRAALMENPAALAMSGPGFGLDNYTFGAMISHEFLGYAAILVALMSLLLVVRHTRTEEESGRAELLRASMVGRYAPMASAVGLVVAVNLVIGLLLAILLPVTLDELAASSSLLLGMSLAGVGITFAGVGALVSQLTFSGRGALGFGAAALGFAYAARAVGDASGQDAVSWLSPIGWAQRTRSYVDDQWWPLLIPVAVAIVLITVAVLLTNRRDVGSGMLHPRPGPAEASAGLAGPIGLAWRLQRGLLLAWLIGLAVLGAMYGTIVPEVESFVEGNELVAEALAAQGADPVAAFFAVVVSLLGMVGGGYVLQSVVRMSTEEAATRVDPILAAAVPRWRFVAGHLLVALIGGAAVLAASSAAMAVSVGVTGGTWTNTGDLVMAGLIYAPALWLLAALAAALYGLAPKLVHLVWALLAFGVVVGLLGVFLNLPDWLLRVSPFEHVPDWLSNNVDFGPLAVMLAITVVLVAVGLYGFRRRDLA